MNDSAVLNLFVLLFFILTIAENSYRPKIPQNRKTAKPVSPVFFLTLIIIGIFLALFFLIFANKDIISWYLRLLISTLVVAHGFWLSLNKKILYRILFILLALLIISFRLIYPSVFSHNLFIFISILWLGPFLVHTGIITSKRFVVVSLFWFVYDIIFVWLSPLSKQVIITTRTMGFPLSIVSGKNAIGLADLFWAGFLLSLLKNNASRFLTIVLLSGSNIVLEFFAINFFRIKVFPLLVLWVPLGLLILFYNKRRD